MFTIMAGNTSEKCGPEAMLETCDRLALLGPLTIFEGERCILKDGKPPSCNVAPAADVQLAVVAQAPAPVYSEGFGEGKQVTDDLAKTRIEAQHATIIAAGIKVDASEQLFSTGTRMMREGYDTQARRKADHASMMLAREAGNELRETILKEGREDRVATGREIAQAITVNGKISCFGLTLTEPAIRGLATRLESPMLGYILGLRNRIAAEHAKGDARDREAIQRDRAKIAEVVPHECYRAGDVEVKLRTRAGVGDVYAAVSPSYVPADAPAVLDQILPDLPRDARGSWNYDPSSTAWELRANVWTPTPVEEQAVGEAFSGHVSFRSRDNGSSSFKGDGGVLLLRCLNASYYTADSSEVSRVHRGRIMYDVGLMLRGATKAIRALCEAWGTNRAQEVELPPVPLSEAIPGFYSWLLRDRQSVLAGVLPGRSAEHVKGLTQAFFDERREPTKLIRSDFAQGWTKYVQQCEASTRREAESAIGDWLVHQGKLGCDLS
jgi:hypothetical protein